MQTLRSTKRPGRLQGFGLRSAALVLAAVLMAVTLSACGEGSDAGGDGETTTTN